MNRFLLSILVLLAALPLQARKVDRGLGEWDAPYKAGVVNASASNNAPVAGSTLYIDEFGFTY